MTYHIDIQHASQEKIPIDDATLISWARLTLASVQESAEVTLRLVDCDEITQLNATYRKQDKATNVLAFPANLPPNIQLDCPLLGDVIICPDILKKESIELKKPLNAHWALIVIHGILHLLGYDHIDDKDATVMQALEIKVLAQLGFDNPYLEDNEIE
ncbi:MAG: rRNA maturation RNase YbeY [Legionellaceae bacterium]|nr:rRNA maturation RNase YbeY [Legionellaceae bacterium]